MTDVSKFEITNVGKDVIIFNNYSQMINTAPVKPLDVRAELLMEFIDSRLHCEVRLEDKDVWKAIIALTPFRMTEEVQDAINKWAAFYAKRIVHMSTEGAQKGEKRSFFDWLKLIVAWFKNILSGNASTDITSAANAYKALDFKKAANIYINILKKDPQNFDARNNLALVCMHQYNDPAALLQLQIISELKKDYFPGLINLTVVAERLGLQNKALETAKQALRMQPNVPAAALNAAWFENIAGNNMAARKILAPIVKLDTSNSKINNLYTLSKKRR